MWIIHAKLPPEAGALVVKAIEAVAMPEQEEKQTALRADSVDRKEVENDSAESSTAGLCRLAPSVTASTCITRWQGESCNYGMAIDAPLWRDSPLAPGTAVLSITEIEKRSD